jgi:putative endonuclease
MYFVYAIYNKNYDKIYIGQCEDLNIRLKLHNDKIFINSYTSKFKGNWIVIYKEEFDSGKTALKREKQLKSYRGRQFIKNFIPR